MSGFGTWDYNGYDRDTVEVTIRDRLDLQYLGRSFNCLIQLALPKVSTLLMCVGCYLFFCEASC